MTMLDKATLLATIAGALSVAFLVAALHFLKFWRRTRTRLFAFFAAAFTLLGVQQVILGLSREVVERSPWLYSLRLLAFLLIIAAIVDANRSERRQS